MSRELRILVIAVVTAGAIALVVATVLFPLRPPFGPLDLLFWIAVALASSAAQVRLPRGTRVSVSGTSVLASGILGGPVAAVVVAVLGTTELRELRGNVPWYGTLANHAGIVVPAFAASTTFTILAGGQPFAATVSTLAATLLAGLVHVLLNVSLSSLTLAVRRGERFWTAFSADIRVVARPSLGLVPLAWLAAYVYASAGWWAALVFALPLMTTRDAYGRIVEIRDMFTQTVKALSSAVDAKDKYTAGHSEQVQLIARAIGQKMHCSEQELEALEWGGLLHDIGKIGIPDAILLKAGDLTREERMIMNSHPVKGADIIRPVAKLAPEVPIILHHHEWFNGSGYPDRLAGYEIPKLARVMHVADAFEAMTSPRPYRLTPLSVAQAVGEIRKFTGVQFDPEVVEAFVKTSWANRPREPHPLLEKYPIPMIEQVAALRARGAKAPAAS